MRMPEILQGEARTRFLQGIAFGAVAAITIGFFWGGWVTGGTAKTMTAMAETNGRMSVLVPICVAQFTAADGAVAKFKAAGSQSAWKLNSRKRPQRAERSVRQEGIQRNERSQDRTAFPSCIWLAGDHPVRRLCAVQ